MVFLDNPFPKPCYNFGRRNTDRTHFTNPCFLPVQEDVSSEGQHIHIRDIIEARNNFHLVVCRIFVVVLHECHASWLLSVNAFSFIPQWLFQEEKRETELTELTEIKKIRIGRANDDWK